MENEIEMARLALDKRLRGLIRNWEALTNKEQSVLAARVSPKKSTLDSIGQNFDVTRERIRQIEANSLRKLRRQPAADPAAVQKNILQKFLAHGAEAAMYLFQNCSNIELSVRTINGLQNARIETIADLVLRSEREMLQIKNFGRKSLREIREVLADRGLSLRDGGADPDELIAILRMILDMRNAAQAKQAQGDEELK